MIRGAEPVGTRGQHWMHDAECVNVHERVLAG
jgi:hypothetical protein